MQAMQGKGEKDGEDLNDTLGHRIKALVLMSTGPEDWSIIGSVASKSPERYIPAFGIHPWKAARYLEDPQWAQLAHDFETMEAALQRHPKALVGEIGLDHSERILGKDGEQANELVRLQRHLFETQWNMACRFARPVSMHCVRADAAIFDFLESQSRIVCSDSVASFPPSFVIHSYTGSGESLKRFFSLSLRTKVYFSLSKVISGRLPDKKVSRLIKLVPDDRILIESDETDPLTIEASLGWSSELIARVKGWTLEDAMQRLVNNAHRFANM